MEILQGRAGHHSPRAIGSNVIRYADEPIGNYLQLDDLLDHEPVSGGEQALVRLAAHLYSGKACDVIGELNRIDDTNYATVMEAFDTYRKLMRR